MPKLSLILKLDRCPHCNIAKPLLDKYDYIHGDSFESQDHDQQNRRFWVFYVCHACGGVTTACSDMEGGETTEIYPKPYTVDESIPSGVKRFLDQAINSIHAPAGAVMLAASAVDAMLKDKGYKDGSLYARIEKAEQEHLITKEMAAWANDVRLDANDQRHADEAADIPTSEDAKRVIDFADVLSQILFVLPNKVQRGIERGKKADD